MHSFTECSENSPLFKAFLVLVFSVSQKRIRFVEHLSANGAILPVRARETVAAKAAIKNVFLVHIRSMSCQKKIIPFRFGFPTPQIFKATALPKENTGTVKTRDLSLKDGLKTGFSEKRRKNLVQTLFFFIFLWYNIFV